MDFIKDINHRMNLIELSDKEMNSNLKMLNEDIGALNMKTVLELKELKEECKSMVDECKTLHKAVYKLGSCLRDKVATTQIEELKKSIEEWDVEDFITRKSLVNSFERYAP